MMDLIIQGGALPTFLLDRIVAATGAAGIEPLPPQVVRLRGAERNSEFDTLLPLLEAEHLDWAFVKSGKRLADFGLIAFDMDSTLITIECIDELADFAGRKHEVAEITEAAMRGKLDYRESLRQRLALLAGLDARVLSRVFEERLQLSPGARGLLAAAQQAGLRTAILSGGFTYFTERLRIELGFDFATSNELEISGGKLTGRVRLAPIKPGNLQVHWPEGNVLLDHHRRSCEAGVPDYYARVTLHRLNGQAAPRPQPVPAERGVPAP